MIDQRLNLSGLWLGSFSYPDGLGPTTPFLATLQEDGGALSGTIVEPNTVGHSSEQLGAIISGSRSGMSVDFTKMYDAESDAAHAVDYVGKLSADGNRISGVWSLETMDGSFEMSREIESEEQAGQEAEVVKLG